MLPASTTIAHLIAADLHADRARELAALHGTALGARQVLVHVGPGDSGAVAVACPLRVHTPVDCRWLNERCLRRALRRAWVSAGPRPVIVHAWSLGALGWCGPSLLAGCRLVVDVAPGLDVTRVLGAALAAGPMPRRTFVCSHPHERRRLIELGVPTAQCVWIEPGLDFVPPDAAQRTAARARLGLASDHDAIVVLPPVERRTGALIATWGAMLLERVRTNVRCVVPTGGAGEARIRHLVEACPEGRTVRFAAPDTNMADLVAAADVGVYVPPGAAPLANVLWTQAAGRRLVTTGPVAEVLAAERTWTCRPNDPADAARQLGAALAARGPAAAPVKAGERFSIARMTSDYRELYANLCY